jgi:hypothetical protein
MRASRAEGKPCGAERAGRRACALPSSRYVPDAFFPFRGASLARQRPKDYSGFMCFFNPSIFSLLRRIICGFPEERYWRSLL